MNPVTVTDQKAEREIISRIKRSFPQDSILAEESGGTRSSAERRWIIDPLDGTVNFAHGLPHLCVSIAYERRGKIIMGGIYDPFRKELFFAERGRGAYLNSRSIRVSQTRKLIKSLIVTGFPYEKIEQAEYYINFYKAFLTRSMGIRRLGSAALDLAYVACGRFDAFWEFNLQPWDVAAGLLLVQEAGGTMTDFFGGDYNYNLPRETLATNQHLQRPILDVFQIGRSSWDKEVNRKTSDKQ